MAKLKLLRNSSIAESHDTAVSVLQDKLATLSDGEICIASYNDATDNGAVKTIFGIKRTEGYTIYDLAAIGADTDEKIATAIQSALQSLDATVKCFYTEQYVIKDGETGDSPITPAQYDELDAAGKAKYEFETTVTNGKHVGIKIVETDGVLTNVSIVEKDIASAQELEALSGTMDDINDAIVVPSGENAFISKVSIFDNVPSEFSKIASDGTINLGTYTPTTEDEGKNITGGIQFGVKHGDTIVSSAGNGIDVNLDSTLVSNANTGAIGVNIDGVTIVKDNSTGVLSVASSALTQYVGDAKTINVSNADANNQKTISTLLKINKVTTGLPSNVKERYALCDTDGTAINGSANIDIYKDSSLKECYIGDSSDSVVANTGVVTKNVYQLGTDPTTKITQSDYDALSEQQKALYEAIDLQSFNFVYQLSDGTYQIVKIDISKFLTEAEFGDGLEVVNGKVSVKIDSTSESYLTVGSHGIKLSGLDTLLSGIDEAIDDIEQTIEDNEHTISAALNDLESRKAEKSDLDTLSDNVLTEVEAGNGINVTAKSNKKQTVSVKLDTVTGSNDNILTVTSDGLYLSNSWDCGSY